MLLIICYINYTGFATAYADYYLMSADETYEPIMRKIEEKIFLSKTVIEFLIEDDTAEYEDLLNKLETSSLMPNTIRVTEDSLLQYAEFVCDRVYNFNATGDEDDMQLILRPCMRTLIQLSGITLGNTTPTGKLEQKRQTEQANKRGQKEWAKAITTPLVGNVFDSFFRDQMYQEDDKFGQPIPTRRKRCGFCKTCQQKDCGKCNCCRDMVKYGGRGRSKKSCVLRKCPNMAVQVTDDDDELIDDDKHDSDLENCNIFVNNRTVTRHDCSIMEWDGVELKVLGGLTFYKAAIVNGERVFSGSYVSIDPEDNSIPKYVAQVITLWEDGKNGDKLFHARWFCRGTDTLLGETCDDPMELFLVEDCKDLHLSAILNVVNVKYKPLDSVKWKSEDGVINDPHKILESNDDHESDTSFWYRHVYCERTGRFEEPPIYGPEVAVANIKDCHNCARLASMQQRDLPKLGQKLDKGGYEVVTWHDMDISVGDAIFLEPDAYVKKGKSKEGNINEDNSKEYGNGLECNYNEDVYPEKYRKTKTIIGSNYDTTDPFCIGYVLSIHYYGIIRKFNISYKYHKLKPVYNFLYFIYLYR